MKQRSGGRFLRVLAVFAVFALAAGCGGDDEGGKAKKCAQNADCKAPTGVCDTVSGYCVECAVDADCAEGFECKDTVCKEKEVTGCASDDDCDDAVLDKCDIASGDCVDCLGDEDCDEGFECKENACEEIVTGCASNDDCDDPVLDKCDTASGDCVDCIDTADCDDGQECVDNACQPTPRCESDADCPDPALPKCFVAAGECVECNENTDCGDGFECVGHACQEIPPCEEDADCADPVYPRCDTGTGECVVCLEIADCDDGFYCTDVFTCELIPGCASDADCTVPAFPRCDTVAEVCVECIETADCEDGFYCTDAFVCEAIPGCATDDDCVLPLFPRCEAVSGLCVECIENADCKDGFFCNADFACEEIPTCEIHDDCTAPGFPYCNKDVEACVPCLLDMHCGYGYICDATFNCVESNISEYQCNPEDPESCSEAQVCTPPGYCAPAGDPNTGGILCLDNEDCEAIFPGIVCDTTQGLCTYCVYGGVCNGNMVCSDWSGLCEEPVDCADDTECLAARTCVDGLCTDPACDPDEFEGDYGNDTYDYAADIQPGDYDLTYCGNEDWFKIALNEGDGLSVDLWDGPDTTLLVIVFAETDLYNPVALSATIYDYQSAQLSAAPAAGNYYIQIFGYVPSGGIWIPMGPYHMSISVFAGGFCARDSFEPDDNQSTAMLLGDALEVPLSICADDEDWFMLTSEDFIEDIELGLKLTYEGTPVTFDSYEIDGTTVAANGVDAGGEITLEAVYTAATPYFFKVAPAQESFDNWTDYSIAVSKYVRVAEIPGCENAETLVFDETGYAAADGTLADVGIAYSVMCSYPPFGIYTGFGPENIYLFEIDETSLVHAEVAAGFDAVLYLRADCPDLSSELNCNFYPVLDTPLYAGKYYLFVDGNTETDMGDYTLTVTATPIECIIDDDCEAGTVCDPTTYECVDIAANDTCDTAEWLALPAEVSGLTNGLANDYELDPDYSCTYYAETGPDAVYDLDLTAGQVLLCSLVANYDAALYILTDCETPSDSCVAGAHLDWWTGAAEIVYQAAEDGKYLAVIDGYDETAFGPYTLSCTLGECLENDDCEADEYCKDYYCITRTVTNDLCSGAAVIDVLPFVSEGDTTEAANDYLGSYMCLYGEEPGNDVVFSFTPADDGRIVVRVTTPEDAPWDPDVYVVTDCEDLDTCVAGTDMWDVSETLVVEVTGGTTYYIIVDSASPYSLGKFAIEVFVPECTVETDCAEGDLCSDDFTCFTPECMENADCDATEYCTEEYTCEERVAGDTCETAFEAVEGDNVGTTAGAVNDYEAATCTYYTQAGGDVVYKLSLNEGDRVVATVTPEAGAWFDPGLYIITDCTDAEGSCKAGADAGGLEDPETVDYTADAIGVYFIIVDSFSESSFGAFTLTIDVNPE